jgi:glycolate oxidase iron-sulfur subunit
MRSYAEDGVDLSAGARLRLDECIVCRACETVCPSGIRMGEMMEGFRHELRRQAGRAGWLAALGRFVLDHVLVRRDRVALLTDLLWLYQQSGLRRLADSILPKLAPRLGRLHGLQSDVPSPRSRRFDAEVEARGGIFRARGRPRLRVGLFLGCIAREWCAPVHRATVRVLVRNGCDVLVPDSQTCCGALHRHSGFAEESAVLFRANAEAFAALGADAVVVNAAGCGAALKEPPHGAEGAPRIEVRDVSEFLDEIGIEPPRAEVRRRVAYDQPCHLLHAQRIGAEVVEGLLRQVPGLELLPLPGSDRCCGAGGVYNLLHPERALQLRDEKVAVVLKTGADTLVTGNPGCAFHLAARLRTSGVEVMHPVEVLDEAYGGGSRQKKSTVDSQQSTVQSRSRSWNVMP